MQKRQLDEQRKKMKQDILNKKKELKGQEGVKVEIVGMPEGMMQEEPSNRKQSSQNTNED